MESFTDEHLDNLHGVASVSTLHSVGSLDDVNQVKFAQDGHKKDLEGQKEYAKKSQEVPDNERQEMEELKHSLEEMTKERDRLKQELEKVSASQKNHKPVSNPLQTLLIDSLILKHMIKSKDVEDVMRSIDRGDFCPKDPYLDRPQHIGFNTTISAPHMHATQLELLKDCLHDAKTALDIGTGSGFVALSIAKMMKRKDFKVYAIDHIPKLIEQAKENVAKNHKEFLDNDQLEFIVADGREGLPQHAPYDVIFVGGAVRETPECLIEQLAPGGSLLIPIGDFYQYLSIIHKSPTGEVEKTAVMAVMFGRLQSVEEQCPDIDE